jgi:predicted negative regulator of RcsB-dependent stress response
MTLLALGSSPAAAAGHEPSPEVLAMQDFMDLMEQYIVLTEQFQHISADGERAAGFAVFQLKDLCQETKGSDEAIKLFKNLLKKTENNTIQNLISLQLAEMLKDRGRRDEAIQVLTQVVLDNCKRLGAHEAQEGPKSK